jgi:GT2 family glycosyltransferase
VTDVSSPQANSTDQAVADGPVRFGPEPDPRVSVIVTGWRDAPYLIDCLRALQARITSVPYEVIVSLNEPTPSLLAALAHQVDGVVVLSTPVNRGFGEACNRGGAAARGELLVLLNDDAIVLDGWLEALVEAADHHDEAGAVGSRILLEHGAIQEEGAVIWSDGATTLIGYHDQAEAAPDLGLRRVDYCSAASLLVRRATWESSGGIDTRYFPAYFEDVDLCMKIQAGGQSILFEPRSVVVHRDGSSTTPTYRTFLAERNKQRFAARWAPALALFEPPEPDDPEAVARAARLGTTRPLPLPGPLPLTDPPDPTDSPVAPDAPDESDQAYLRRQLGVLMDYAASLEDTLTANAVAADDFAARIEGLEKEIDRLHHEAAALQGRVKELEDEITVFTLRGRYKMIDRTYEIATAVPGFRRALHWADGRHRARTQPPAPD